MKKVTIRLSEETQKLLQRLRQEVGLTQVAAIQQGVVVVASKYLNNNNQQGDDHERRQVGP